LLKDTVNKLFNIMPQHDLIIDNQTFPATRADINNALQSLGSVSSGTVEPLVIYPNQLWADTTNLLLKQRNTGNTAWMTVGKLNQTNLGLLNDTVLTGNPTAATQGNSNNSTRLATTAFVKNGLALYVDFPSNGTLQTDNVRRTQASFTAALGTNVYRIAVISANFNCNTGTTPTTVVGWIRDETGAIDLLTKSQGIPSSIADGNFDGTVIHSGSFTGNYNIKLDGLASAGSSYAMTVTNRKLYCLFLA
jgi:hypothetical protein